MIGFVIFILIVGIVVCIVFALKDTDSKEIDDISKKTNKNKYIGNTQNMTLHRPDCTYCQKIFTENYVSIDSYSHAIAVGYKPCKKCNPK